MSIKSKRSTFNIFDVSTKHRSIISLSDMTLPRTMYSDHNNNHPQEYLCYNSSTRQTMSSSSSPPPSSSALSFYLKMMIDELGIGPEDVTINVDNSHVHHYHQASSSASAIDEDSMPPLDACCCVGLMIQDDSNNDSQLSDFMSSLLSSYKISPNDVSVVEDRATPNCPEQAIANTSPISKDLQADDTYRSHIQGMLSTHLSKNSRSTFQDPYNGSCSTFSEDSTIYDDDYRQIFFPDESFITVETAPCDAIIKTDYGALQPSPTSVLDIRKRTPDTF